MTNLTLPLNPLTFDQLFELGRSAIPTLAPRWTDHNFHDPGIMLVELLAWIAEAQMYSMDRLRRNERQAYANLLGVEPRGPVAARGLVWPVGISWSAGQVVAANMPVLGDRASAPVFYAADDIQLTKAKLVRVETHYGNGISHDWTRVNEQETATFMPFGAAPQTGVRLVLTFDLAAADRPVPGTPVSLGFEVDNAARATSSSTGASNLVVSLADANGTRVLAVTKDTTSGLLESGVLLLEAGTITPESGRFQLILRSATGGFERPPRVRHIGLNVLTIEQLAQGLDEVASFGTALPDQQYTVPDDGLIFQGGGAAAVKVKIFEGNQWTEWTMTEDLATSGPDDRHFELDPVNGVLTFGNGVNGRVMPKLAGLQASYRTSAGSAGNLQAKVKWSVKGIQGVFGINPQPTTGGEDATSLDDLRGSARIRFDTARPLVTAEDVQSAALSYTDLGVTRAVELPLDSSRLEGDRVLLVTGPHDTDSANPGAILAEEPELLEAVRRRIAPRLPLGQKLQVVGPSYVPVRITATLTAARNTDPNAVQANAIVELQKRLAVVTPSGTGEWPLGRPISARSVQGWLRRVDGVAQVQKVELRARGSSTPATVITLAQRELPSLTISPSDISVARPAEGGSE